MTPHRLARIGGALYLVVIALGLLGETVVRGTVVAAGDDAATAANLAAHETLWRLGIAAELALLVCGVTLTLVLFVLLRPVNKDLALLAVFFNLVSLAVEAAAALALVAALLATDPDVTGLAVDVHSYGFGAGLIFFGCACVVFGYLIYRSQYFPRPIGILLQIAGACYLANSFALVLAPSVSDSIFPGILLPAFVGEASLCLWLLVKGVDADRISATA